MAREVIIDTDPGVDDAMAILFALASPELEVIGLTTVFGNVDLATANALKILEVGDQPQIPVAEGASCPLAHPFSGPADFVHGTDGLGDAGIDPPRSEAVSASAVDFLIESIMSHPGRVTLVPLGPLTNLANALEQKPDIAENVDEVVLMGGAATVNGNINPAAEANIFKDPHAADKVFTAPWKVTMIGLDVTMKVLMSEEYINSLCKNEAGNFISRISQGYLQFHRDAYGINAMHTHDPSAIAFLINPDLFELNPGSIRVPTDGLARGQTIWNRRESWLLPNQWSDVPSVNVAVDVDGEGCLELFRARIC